MTVLGSDKIKARAGEIFKDGTFKERCLRPAAYDLRAQLVTDRGFTTAICREDSITFEKGHRAILETYEVLAMPWDLAGNIGVKYRLGMHGLLVSPGLFVDPGFGWREDDDDELVASGDRLRFAVTNVGKDPIRIGLGREGEGVLAIQFLPVVGAVKRQATRGIHPDPQGLAFFEDLTRLETSYKELEKASRRTEVGLEIAVNLAVFLIAFTILGAIVSFLLSTLASGDGVTQLIAALNDLRGAPPWTSITLTVFLVFVLSLVVLASVAIVREFRAMRRRPGAVRGAEDDG